MPYEYGTASRAKLDTCHPYLQQIMELAILRSPYDITIVHGWRGEEVQNALKASGASTKAWPHSKHNRTNAVGNPFSHAVDFAPWVNGGIPWGETHIFAAVAGVIMACAAELGIGVRWGGDWDSDGTTTDQTLMDWGHMELVI